MLVKNLDDYVDNFDKYATQAPENNSAEDLSRELPLRNGQVRG